jgi:hypothetical protein
MLGPRSPCRELLGYGKGSSAGRLERTPQQERFWRRRGRSKCFGLDHAAEPPLAGAKHLRNVPNLKLVPRPFFVTLGCDAWGRGCRWLGERLLLSPNKWLNVWYGGALRLPSRHFARPCPQGQWQVRAAGIGGDDGLDSDDSSFPIMQIYCGLPPERGWFESINGRQKTIGTGRCTESVTCESTQASYFSCSSNIYRLGEASPFTPPAQGAEHQAPPDAVMAPWYQAVR